MIPDIENIELSLMSDSRISNFRQELVVFRVTDITGIVNHECDCLIMSKAGYLREYEIKRSFQDFVNDFKKNNIHDDDRIGEFFYVVHESFSRKVIDFLVDKRKIPTGIWIYGDDGKIIDFKDKSVIENAICKEENKSLSSFVDFPESYYFVHPFNKGCRKLFIEEKLKLARLGAMRYKNMTEKLIRLKEELKEK